MPGSVVEQLLGLRKQITAFNASRGMRTALLYSNGWFVQWHEGPRDAVEAFWAAAQAHPGNAHSRLIHRSDGVATLPRPLHIASLHGRDKPSDVARRIYAVERERELGWVAEPHEIWEALSAPCTIRGADAMSAAARTHIVAVTSEFNESVDLVKAVADRSHTPVTYQRFADGDPRNPDIGAAYVDTVAGGQMTRLHALSRRAMEDGMVQLSMRRMHCLVLLLGNRQRPTSRLAATTAEVLARMPTRPPIRLVGPCLDTCDDVARALRGVAGLNIASIRAGIPGRSRADAVLDSVADGSCTMPAELDLLLS
nr:BLUF domain-containing protein [Caenimonas aquaedulcis]